MSKAGALSRPSTQRLVARRSSACCRAVRAGAMLGGRSIHCGRAVALGSPGSPPSTDETTQSRILAQEGAIAEHQARTRQLYAEGRYKEAEGVAADAVQLAKAHFGEVHPVVGACLNDIAACRKQAGEFEEATDAYREAINVYEAAFGTFEHSSVATATHNLGQALKAQAESTTGLNRVALLDGAKEALERGLSLRRATLSPGSPEIAISMWSLASVLRLQGDVPSAERLLCEAVEMLREGVDGSVAVPLLATALNNLGYHYRCVDQFASALPLYEEALKLRLDLLGRAHPDTITVQHNLAELYRAMGDEAAAIELQEEILRSLGEPADSGGR